MKKAPLTVVGLCCAVTGAAIAVATSSGGDGERTHVPRVTRVAHEIRVTREHKSMAAAFALPDPVPPAFRVGKATRLTSLGGAIWAPVVRTVEAQASPSTAAPVVASVATRTPEGTANIVTIIGKTRDRGGRLWLRVRLAVLPNGTTGWVERGALGSYGVVYTHLVVNLERLELTLLRDGKPVFRAPVGVGKPAWPTPKGQFYIRNRISTLSDPVYGPLAFGTSARSPTLTDWPAGGYIGIHGTNQPELIPGHISHGCIRLRNEDILRLGRLLQPGTPLTIH